MLFHNLEKMTLKKIVAEMYEKSIPAGEILIQQGDMGISASQLYVVKSGKFEVSWEHLLL
jgi:cGMP-dependent protein kinase 2